MLKYPHYEILGNEDDVYLSVLMFIDITKIEFGWKFLLEGEDYDQCSARNIILTTSLLIKGFCKIGQMDQAESFTLITIWTPNLMNILQRMDIC